MSPTRGWGSDFSRKFRNCRRAVQGGCLRPRDQPAVVAGGADSVIFLVEPFALPAQFPNAKAEEVVKERPTSTSTSRGIIFFMDWLPFLKGVITIYPLTYRTGGAAGKHYRHSAETFLHEGYRGLHEGSTRVPRGGLQEGCTRVPRGSHEGFTRVSRGLQEGCKRVSRGLHEGCNDEAIG